MRLVVDLVIVINAIIGIAGVVGRKLYLKRRSTNLDHIRQLEQENEEIDELIERRNRKR